MYKTRPFGLSQVWRSSQPLLALRSSARHWAAFILCLSLLLRLAYAVVAPQIDPLLARDPLHGDAASYDRIARTLLAGGPYGEAADDPSAFWPPLYPLALAAVYSVAGYDLLVARIVQALVGALLPLAVFLVGLRLATPAAARLASLAAAVYPYFLYFGAWLIADGLFLTLVGLMLWAGGRLQGHGTYAGALGFGLIIGAAALTKPTLLMQLPFVAIWFLVSIRSASLRRRLALGVVAALAVLLVLLPWSARNYGLFGKPVLVSTNGGYTFYGANNPNGFGGHYEGFPLPIAGLDEVEEQAEYYRLGTAWIRENPGDFAGLVVKKYQRLVSPLSVASSEQDLRLPGDWLIRLGYGLLLLAALYGAARSLRRWREVLLLYIPILGVVVSTLLFYGDARFLLPAAPSLLLFAAIGVDSLRARYLGGGHT